MSGTSFVGLALLGLLGFAWSVWPPGVANAQSRTEALLKSCGEKTRVMKDVEGKFQTVGERIDGRCEGYLVGVYEILIETRAICAPEEPPGADYLLSVVQTYLKAEPAGGRHASQVLRTAYLRAFPCKESKKR